MPVLIVDGTRCFRRSARQLLDRRGYIVAGEADSVATAVAAGKRLAPDAELLDLHLSDGSGLEVCAALSRARRTPAVLLMSVFDLPERDRLVKHSGASGFVPKAVSASPTSSSAGPAPVANGQPGSDPAHILQYLSGVAAAATRVANGPGWAAPAGVRVGWKTRRAC